MTPMATPERTPRTPRRVLELIERRAQPCGCRVPWGLCPTGQSLFDAESRARDAYLAAGRDGAPQAAQQDARAHLLAARTRYDAHIGLETEAYMTQATGDAAVGRWLVERIAADDANVAAFLADIDARLAAAPTEPPAEPPDAEVTHEAA